MDPVNSLGQIVRLLRQRLAAQSTTTRETSTAAGNAATASRTKTPARPTADEIKRRIGERIRTLPAVDRRGTRAARIFVESVITWEFGAQLLRDAEFSELASDVVATMRDDPAVWEQFQSLLGELDET